MNRLVNRAGGVAAGFAALCAVLWMSIESSRSRATAARVVEPTIAGAEVAKVLTRLQIAPDGLAAAGFTASDLQAMWAATLQSLASNLTSLKAADAAVSSAQRDFQAARAALDADDEAPTTGTVEQCQARIASASATRDSLLATIRSDALAGQASAKLSALATIQRNRAWSVPLHFAAIDRAESGWTSLRAALSVQRTAIAAGEPVPTWAQAAIDEALSDSSVSAALAASSTNFAAVRASWENLAAAS